MGKKRDREWKADKDLLKNLPKSGTIFHQGNLQEAEFNNFTAWLYQWARDMHAWGQDVRDDIIRLEGRAGFASGDPGDPPDGPPNGE